MDIRNFFSPTNSSKKATDNFTAISSKVNKDKKRKRKLVIIDSDSDEDPFPTKKSPKTVNGISPSKSNVVKCQPNKTPPKTKLNFGALKKAEPDVKSLKPVASNDFFKRTPAKCVSAKTEFEKDHTIDIEDVEFIQTLDAIDNKAKKPKLEENGTVSTKSKNHDLVLKENESSRKTKTEKELSSSSKMLLTKTSKEKQTDKSDDFSSKDNVDESEKCITKQKSTKSDNYKTVNHRKIEENKPRKLATTKKLSTDSDKPAKTVAPEKNSIKREKPSKLEPVKSTAAGSSTDLKTPTPRTEASNDLNDSTLTTPENKRNSQNYFNYLHREGPQSLGSKEIPEGQENCFKGFTFIITGVLDSFERDEVRDLVIKYGGKVMSTLSKNTQYMIVGRDAGPAKLDKAEKLGTKLLNEDEFLDLLRKSPGNKTSPKSGHIATSKSSSAMKKLNKDVVSCKSPVAAKKVSEGTEKQAERTENNSSVSNRAKNEFHVNKVMSESSEMSSKPKSEFADLMWVDKYKPMALNQVVGQQGDRSCANKLLYWLRNWFKNHTSVSKAVSKKWNAKDDGSVFKAALLSGPPGVGKTTTAVLACKEVGFQFIELNASDTRSKKSLQTEISELLHNKTISGTLGDKKLVQKHAVIFDEVDGMSGNEDRGGTQELIALIKSTRVPVICICNDRQHPKIRSLANYCYDLRFYKPRVEQIKGAMLSLLHKEKVKVPPETLQDIIVASNQDIRQVLHHLSFLSMKSLSHTSAIKTANKDMKLGPFDVLKKVFSTEESKTTVNEKASLFFHDYSLAPLFVQENYPSVKPVAAKANIHKHLSLLSEAADSIACGDIIDRCIRSQNNWGLLPTQAIFASVIPGECMRGYLSQQIAFPTWLGKNSSRNHMDRVLQQLHMHTRLRVSANKTELASDYLSQLSHKLTKPLIEFGSEGVPQTVDVMENYYLLREDLDSIIELTHWPNQKDPMSTIEPKTKAALTRTLNKECIKNPYATVTIKKGKKSSADMSFEGDLDEEGNEAEMSEDEDQTKLDAMVKEKKPAKSAKNSSQESESTSKGKGRGKSSVRGRGRGKK